MVDISYSAQLNVENLVSLKFKNGSSFAKGILNSNFKAKEWQNSDLIPALFEIFKKFSKKALKITPTKNLLEIIQKLRTEKSTPENQNNGAVVFNE